MRNGVTIALMAGLSCGAWAVAAPETWSVMQDRSVVEFLYIEDGAGQRGTFERFRGSGTLDPEAPEIAKLEIEVHSASISLGSGLVDAFATSAEWFDSENHPLVIYRLDGLERLDGTVYMATGRITIRGTEKAISTPVTLEFTGGEARATGELNLERSDFGLGVGPSAAFVEIGDKVAVRFDLIARPVR